MEARKINSSQKLYYWNNTNNEFIEVGFIEEQEPPKLIDNFFVGYSVANFPLSGSDNILYKAVDTQKIYYWNSIDNSYKTIDSEIVFPEDKDTNNILRSIFTIKLQALLLGIVISLIFAILLSVTIITPIKSLTQRSKKIASAMSINWSI